MAILKRVGDPPVGYAWERDTGWRVVIVVDDWFDLPVWEPDADEEYPSAHAYGLVFLRDRLLEEEGTRSVAFFKLPDPDSQAFEEDIHDVINHIDRWMLSLKDDECRSYLLVDYFYGEGVKKAHMSGISFVEHWRQWESENMQNALPTKLAHISVSGAGSSGTAVSNPYNLEVFSKTELQATKKLSQKLRDWLDINEHPLIRLWRISSGWFAADRQDDDVMKHTKGNIQEYFDNLDDGRLATYRRNVENALGFQLPNSWWSDPDSVGNIHESLKCLCGSLFCGQCEHETKKAISTGAAFLIALMAHKQQCDNVNALTRNERMWLNCSKVATSIFPKQDRRVAEESAMALYDCFRLIFEVRNRTDSNSVSRDSQVNNILFVDQGRMLRIELLWNAHHKALDRDKSLSEMMAEVLQKNPLQIPASPPKNTLEALLRLWALMAVSEDGCFAPGVVYLENNFLTVASVK